MSVHTDRATLEKAAKSRAFEFYREVRSLNPAVYDDMRAGFADGYVQGFLAATRNRTDETRDV